MKLTTPSPFLLPTSQTPPEQFWEEHAVSEAAKKPGTLEEAPAETRPVKSARSKK
ncbi:MAG: hypothetical protein ACRCXB_25145 [Aeromonadaceae bacterium]